MAATRLLFSLVLQAANQPSRFEFRQEARSEGPSDHRSWRSRYHCERRDWVSRGRHKKVKRPGIYLSHVTPGSAADRAGLRVGDRLVRFAGEEVGEESRLGIAIWAASSPTAIVVARGHDEILEMSADLDGEPLRYGISWREDKAEPGTVVLIEVVPQSAAHQAGLQVGDRIYRVADRDFRDGRELSQRLSAPPGPVPFLVERQGASEDRPG